MKIEIEIDVAMLANDVKAGISYDDIKKRAIEAVIAGSVARIVGKLEPVTKKLEDSITEELKKKETSVDLRKKMIEHAVSRLSYNQSCVIERKTNDLAEKIIDNDKAFVSVASKDIRSFISSEVKRLVKVKIEQRGFMDEIEEKLSSYAWDAVSGSLEDHTIGLDITMKRAGKVIDKESTIASIGKAR